MKTLPVLNPIEFKNIASKTDVIILDVRNEKDFISAHIPNSIFIGLDGIFHPWVSLFIEDLKQPILLVIPEGREQETITRLSDMNYTSILGYLKGGLEVWKEATMEYDTINSISATKFKQIIDNKKVPVFDVRKKSEYDTARINTVKLTPLNSFSTHISEFPLEETFYIHCGGGYRSVIAASILKRKGIHNLVDVAGGFGAIKKTGIPIF